MPGTVILGLQWGDEGKGKVVDYLLSKYPFQAVARFNGGPNAGHTIKVKDKTYKFHQLPSGSLNPNLLNIIGNGCVVEPDGLQKELIDLMDDGIESKLAISERAQVIMPWHEIIDSLEGQIRRGNLKETEKGSLLSSSTGKGIGPCYADRASRFGITVGDCLDKEELTRKLKLTLPIKEAYIDMLASSLGKDALGGYDADDLAYQLNDFARYYGHGVSDTAETLNGLLKDGKRVLFEGAQSHHLDTSLGVYPYSTSSICVAAGASSGTGVPMKYLTAVVGVVKAYTSRSGDGAFPTEIRGSEAEDLREMGQEYGTTTGKPRRVGYFDVPMVKSAVEQNGVDWLALTRMDTLAQFAHRFDLNGIPLCVAYEFKGEKTTRFPTMNLLGSMKPVYEWPIGYDEYIRRIEQLVSIPVRLVGTGPERDDIEVRDPPVAFQ